MGHLAKGSNTDPSRSNFCRGRGAVPGLDIHGHWDWVSAPSGWPRVRQRRGLVGSDRTLAVDVASVEEIERHLRRAAERVAWRVRAQGYKAHGVRVRLKTSGVAAEAVHLPLELPATALGVPIFAELQLTNLGKGA